MFTDVLESIEDVGAKAAAADVAGLFDDELTEAALRLQRSFRQLEAARLAVLAELEARGVTDREFGHPTANWLAVEVREPRHECRNAVAVARTCRRLLGETHTALRQGEISFAHARVLVKAANPRIADDIAALQPQLIRRAGEVAFSRWQAEVHRLVELLDQDGAYDPEREREKTRVSVTPLHDGSTQLCAELYGEDAVTVSEAIRVEADLLFHQFRRDQEADPTLEMPSRAFLEAKALVSLCRKGLARDIGSSEPPRPEAFLILDPATPDVVQLGDGQTIETSRVAGLLSDPDWRAVAVGESGRIDMSPGRRFTTHERRAALAVRDGGCVFPGCEHPPGWTDAHHVVPHGEGGETVTENLASLCRHHHGVTHRNGWHMEQVRDRGSGDPPGHFQWTTPAGRVIYSQHRHHPT